MAHDSVVPFFTDAAPIRKCLQRRLQAGTGNLPTLLTCEAL